ncbi:MAG: LysR substrate-binding domain-containing protein, partial [Pseudomonadota bacterium]|nr:LysR substrate-binding domain-containing protein [Pseudomonadota bacterium]
MQDLNDLYYYAKVVEYGGFSAAGRLLNLPKSKLSRRITLLEERLGVRLIQRSSRQFVVTEIGQIYYQHCRAMLVEAETAQESIEQTRAEPQGIVRIACPSAMLHFHLGRMLNEYMRLYPKVQVYLQIKNQDIDPLRDGFDLAVRVRFPPFEDSDVVVKKLGVSRQKLVAHPCLLAQHTLPLLPLQIAELPSLALGELHTRHFWCLENQTGDSLEIGHTPRFVATDMAALYYAALAGIGVAQLPTMMIVDQLQTGVLVDLLPQWFPREAVIQAAF